MSFYKVETNGIIQGRRGSSQRGSGGGFELYNNSVLKNKFNPTKESTPYHDVVKGRPSFQPGTDEELPLSGKSIPSLRSMFPARTKWNEFDFPRSSYETKKVMSRGEYLNVAFEMGFKADSLTQAVDLGDKTLDTLFGKKKEVWEPDANGVLRSTGKMERPNSIKNILESSKSVNKKLKKINEYMDDNKGMLSSDDKKVIADAVNKAMIGINLNTTLSMDKIIKELKIFTKEVGKIDRSVFTFPELINKEVFENKGGEIVNFLINNAIYNNDKGDGISLNTPLYTATQPVRGEGVVTKVKPMTIASFGSAINNTPTKILDLSDIDYPIWRRKTLTVGTDFEISLSPGESESKEGEEEE